MFRCEKCQTVVPVRTRSTKITVASRPRTYETRGQEARDRGERWRPRGRMKVRGKPEPYDKGGEGREIVRELSVCPRCAEEHRLKMQQEQDAQQAQQERQEDLAVAGHEEE